MGEGWAFSSHTCHVPQKEGAVLGILRHLRPIDLNGQNNVFFAKKCIRLVRGKLTVVQTRYRWNLRFIGFPKIQVFNIMWQRTASVTNMSQYWTQNYSLSMLGHEKKEKRNREKNITIIIDLSRKAYDRFSRVMAQTTRTHAKVCLSRGFVDIPPPYRAKKIFGREQAFSSQTR